jgi:hypothetical protein
LKFIIIFSSIAPAFAKECCAAVAALLALRLAHIVAVVVIHAWAFKLNDFEIF